MLSIASWNCQADPTGESLSTGFLQRLLTDHDIVVLQSCGALVGSSIAAVATVTVGRIRCSVRGARHPISVDPSCCTAILSRLGSDHPLQGGEMLEIGTAGRFGIACDVSCNGRRVLVAALHAASGGICAEEAALFTRMLVDRAGADPVLIAAELGGGIGAAWPGGTGRAADRAMVALVDNRHLACPSPGRRHDSFAAMRLVPSGTVARGVIDSGGASDHDAVHASFALQGGADDPILCPPAGRVR